MGKLLTVFGATGQQGGSLIRYVLDNPALSSTFALRGVTRNACKPSAIDLRERGVEIVEADMDIRSSLDKAVAGSYAVFGMTNYWEKASAEVEVAQGKAIADAAVAAGATQMIWSSLPNLSNMNGGISAGVDHFDSKAEVEEYIRSLPIKSIFFMPGWFMQNHLTIMRPTKAKDDTYVLTQPWSMSTALPLIDIRDAGKFIAPALLDPELYHGKRFTCATAFYTLADMVATWTEVTGKTVVLHVPDSRSEYEGLPDEQKEEGVDAASQISKFGYFGPSGPGDLAWTIQQVPVGLRTWEEFVREHEPWF